MDKINYLLIRVKTIPRVWKCLRCLHYVGCGMLGLAACNPKIPIDAIFYLLVVFGIAGAAHNMFLYAIED